MWGTRNPSNILLESDCSRHERGANETGDDAYSNQQHYLPEQKYRSYNTERCDLSDRTRCFEPTHKPAHTTSKHTYATPDEVPSRKTASELHSRAVRPTEYGEQFSERIPQTEIYGTVLRPTEYGENYGRAGQSDIHSKMSRPSDYHEQFRQGIADINMRPTEVDNYAGRESGNDHVKGNQIKCSRDKPRGTPFSCNDCREPQCLYCWRKWRDAGGDFAFLDGFESHEPAWKPSKKHVDLFNDGYSEMSQNVSRRSLEDPHPQNQKWKPRPCQPSYPPEKPKLKPSQVAQLLQECPEGQQYETTQQYTQQHSKNQECSVKENEWQWPLGKGRGMGPGRGEWAPPFRNYSSLADFPQFQRHKGVGAAPNTEDWVPPFRGDEQPYNWPRSKGQGGCPPRDQWLAPWTDSNERNRVDRIYGGRASEAEVCKDT